MDISLLKIAAILQDGGIPILAHPCVYDNYDEIENMSSLD